MDYVRDISDLNAGLQALHTERDWVNVTEFVEFKYRIVDRVEIEMRGYYIGVNIVSGMLNFAAMRSTSAAAPMITEGR